VETGKAKKKEEKKKERVTWIGYLFCFEGLDFGSLVDWRKVRRVKGML
jgi:hypothetical protein